MRSSFYLIFETPLAGEKSKFDTILAYFAAHGCACALHTFGPASELGTLSSRARSSWSTVRYPSRLSIVKNFLTTVVAAT